MQTNLTEEQFDDIKRRHHIKFKNTSPQKQLEKVNEELEELSKVNTVEELIEETCDVIISTIGLHNHKQYLKIAEAIYDYILSMANDIKVLKGRLYEEVNNKMKIVESREYKNNHH